MEPWRPNPRNPMDSIEPNTFRFHFPNLLYASGRKLCYLCFQVEREDDFSYNDSNRGVFRNKVHSWATCHVEQCFLSWFCDQYPYRDEYYNVTWFLSWSPCPTCAKKVVEFLEEYRNLTLSIFTSRLYYFWDPNYQQGLRKLWDAGVQLDIMFCDDFEYCWDNFVDHKGMRFQRRNLLKDYDFLAAELQEILRNPMDSIDPNTFRFHFPNLLYASGRKLCYLCFQVEREDDFSHNDSDQGVFRNKVHPWARCHAEECFLSWFRDQYPYRDEYYNVTWFLSWSPCPTCAEEVVEFLEEYRNLTLSIFASRLYYFWDPNYQQGLRKLWDAGVQLDIMSCDDFEYCWENFVDHKGMRFQRRNLLKDYDFLAAELQEILR
ncbi:DNA dC-_dU-editing enzyme APOBEC-3Ca isoform X1 [Prionailurus viverrinus]|uniref:DNA dC->dU-editing enzyme APOBEC-3Ca isoform X1 n=2 Tax=Prionailurus viverrinus TaxID=61388 RepID=UPI001FF493EE|nr:DNA dC->dU-editing enzyme APOBEC-3Ca isoform X1 [Prionailurus viverrinus]